MSNSVREQKAFFGPFQFDLDSRELKRDGVRLSLENKPAQLLAALITHAGVLIDREELCKLLWPNGVHVDFEHGLNKSVNKLRFVLGDDPDRPRYIETLSRRGYRFIAAVDFRCDAGRDIPRAGTLQDVQSEEDRIPSGPLVSASEGFASRHSLAVAAILCVVLVSSVLSLSLKGFLSKLPYPPGPVRLAVLPLHNMTGDPSRDYICDGLTQELISRLSTLSASRLNVIAHSSVMRYKARDQRVRQIGTELAADYVIEGSVSIVAGRYRVVTRLIDTHSETVRWTGSFDRELKDILDVHGDVALAVGQELGVHVLPQFQMPAPGSQPINAESHEYYLRGLYHLNKRTVADLRDAIDDFNQAIAAQPSYAEAYSGVADAYSLLATFGGAPYREAYPKARDAALRSLALDRTAQALTSLAFVEGFYDWKVVKAEEDFRAAIQLNPSYATAHHWYGLFLNLRDRHAEAIPQLVEASQLDPLSIAISSDLAIAYSDAGRYDDAIAELKKLQAREPDHFGSYRGLAIVYAAQHRFPEAEMANEEFKKRSGSYLGIGYILAYQYVEAGQLDRGEAVIQDMLGQAKLHGDSPPCPLDAYLALGEDDLALHCLSRLIEERSDSVISLPLNPRMARVLNDPRFHNQLKRTGLVSDLPSNTGSLVLGITPRSAIRNRIGLPQ